jgi:hypothetical protein
LNRELTEQSAYFAGGVARRSVDRWPQSTVAVSVCYPKASSAGVRTAETTRFRRGPNLITICEAIPPPNRTKVAQNSPQSAVIQLASEELNRFSQWFEEFLADQWDQRIETDILAGRLDETGRRAEKAFESGRCTPLAPRTASRPPSSGFIFTAKTPRTPRE